MGGGVYSCSPKQKALDEFHLPMKKVNYHESHQVPTGRNKALTACRHITEHCEGVSESQQILCKEECSQHPGLNPPGTCAKGKKNLH